MKAKSFTVEDLINALGHSYYFVAKTDNVYRDIYKRFTIHKDEGSISGRVCGFVLWADLQKFIDTADFTSIELEDALTYLKTMN